MEIFSEDDRKPTVEMTKRLSPKTILNQIIQSTQDDVDRTKIIGEPHNNRQCSSVVSTI